MTASDPESFRLETGARTFPVEAPWRLVVPPGEPPRDGWPLVLALHGWGMSAGSFARRCRPLLSGRAAFLFPQGPFGFELRPAGKIRIGYAWYLFDGGEEPFRSTLAQTEAHLLGLIDEIGGTIPLDPRRRYLVGFSQGAYAGYFLAIRNSDRFSGMVAIGGGRLREDFIAEGLAGGRKIPILLVHGTADAAVPLERPRLMKDLLDRHGFPTELATFDVGHEPAPPLLDAARAWIERRIAAP